MFTGSGRHRFYQDRRIRKRRVRSIVRFLLLWFLFYQVVSIMLVASFTVRSTSMDPTLASGNRVLVTPVPYGSRIPLTRTRLPGTSAPARGDVVVVRPPFQEERGMPASLADPMIRFFSGNRASFPGDRAPEWQGTLLIKRVIGLPGDTIRIRDHIASIRPAGERHFLTEFELSRRDYDISTDPLPSGWTADDPFSGTTEEVTLDEDEYFLLGDHRSRSSDSRLWGPVGKDRLVGRLFFRYWPLRAFGLP